MDTNCYKLPLRFSALFDENGGHLERCTELQSVDQHLEMLLTTCPGEHRFDENYGCRIWELDFELVASGNKWKEQFTSYVRETVLLYERRLTDIRIQVDLREVARQEISDNLMVRKRVDIRINATLISNGQQCMFGYKLYLGPLSNE